ncbi:hypothetical protein [Planktothrix agardhii]|nr:hypothetical protein [Planktothrix agardhii]
MIAQFYHNPRAIAFSNRKEAIALNYYGWLRISSFPGSCLGMYDG